MKPKKTLLIGSFGAGNIGDELILTAARARWNDSIVMTANPEASQKFSAEKFLCIPRFPAGFSSFLIFLCSPARWFGYRKTAQNIDQIVFPGGGLFSKKPKAVWIWAVTIWWCRLIFRGKPVKLFHQGIDIPDSKITQKLSRWALKNADEVTVRDKKSAENFTQLTQLPPPAIVNDIVAVWLKQQENLEEKTKKTGVKKPKDIKKIFINNVTFPVGKWEKLQKKISKKFPNAVYEFLIFGNEDMDGIPENFPSVAKALDGTRGKIRTFPRDKHELFAWFDSADVMIGQRFHSLILGLHWFGSENTYLLGKPYAPKTATFAKENNLTQI